MKRVRRKQEGKNEPTSGSKQGRKQPRRKSFALNFLDSWAAKAELERSEWLNKPRLHTAIFEEFRRDNEIEKLIAAKRATL